MKNFSFMKLCRYLSGKIETTRKLIRLRLPYVNDQSSNSYKEYKHQEQIKD
jgi:hypothetical protein